MKVFKGEQSMKRIVYLTLAAAATLSLFSCSKDNAGKPGSGIGESTGKIVSVSASIPEEGMVAKVSFAEDETTKRLTKVSWAAGDVISINGKEFAIVASSISADGKTATFTGEEPEGGAPYEVTYNSIGSSDLNAQRQDADGSTDHLGYKIVTSVSDYKTISFAGATTQSSVLQLRALLPNSIKNSVTKVIFKSNLAVFNGQKELSVALADGALDSNDRLDVYATIPEGDVIPTEDLELLVQFQVSAKAYDKYTAYRVFAAGTYSAAQPFFASGSSQYIGINCSNIESFANATTTGIGSASNPYLVGDQNQWKAISLSGTKQYYKLVDDIDMTGVTTSLNAAGTGVIGLDGNSKVLRNLKAPLFDDLNGSVADLTIEGATVSGGSAISGILANTIKTAASTVTNVDINSSSITATAYSGGLIGQIDAANTSVANCKVSDTNVTGTLAGGVVGFANALVTMSGCTYSGGTVKGSARYSGGMVASTSNFNSVISDCHVENATISVSVSNNDFRAGGFIGLQQASVQVKGCSVGKPGENVTINLSAPASGKVYNVGGFVGVNYGTITQNSSVRTTAYVTITAGNTATNAQLNLGGFAGYNTGKIEYSDAIVTMSDLKGQYIGGFCGILLQSGKIENSTETGVVSGNNYTGGFVGVIDSATTSITGCSSSGSVTGASSIGGFAGGCTAKDKAGVFTGNSTSANVTSSGSNFGGFIGNGVGTFTSNYATGNVASTGGGNGGGFAGGVWEASTGSVFSKNYATGNVSGNANLGGLIGYIGGNLTLSDCFATGNVGNSTKYNQKYGGLVGFTSDNATYITEGVTIINCYATGDVEPSFAGGGLIGRIGLATTSVRKCVAWNTRVYPHSSGSANWSSAAVVGVTFPSCTLTDNYRNPSMNLTAYWVPADMTTFQHANVSSAHPLTDSTGAEMADTATASGQTHYPQYPYHGKVETGKTLSQLASTTLGWSSDVWDFSGPLPLLK